MWAAYKIKSLFNEEQDTREMSFRDNEMVDAQFETIDVEQCIKEARRERLNIHSRAYTAGWVVRKVLKKYPNCINCKKCLTVDKATDVHKWVSHREYKTLKKDKLTYAAEHAVIK